MLYFNSKKVACAIGFLVIFVKPLCASSVSKEEVALFLISEEVRLLEIADKEVKNRIRSIVADRLLLFMSMKVDIGDLDKLTVREICDLYANWDLLFPSDLSKSDDPLLYNAKRFLTVIRARVESRASEIGRLKTKEGCGALGVETQ